MASSKLLWFGFGYAASHAVDYGIKKYDLNNYSYDGNFSLTFRTLSTNVFGWKHKEIPPSEEFEKIVLGYDPELDGDAEEHFKEHKKQKDKRFKDEDIICLGQ